MNELQLLPCARCGKYPLVTARMDDDDTLTYHASCNCRYPAFESLQLIDVIEKWNKSQGKTNE